ncbi:hypothetical protein [Pseudomonas sp. P8_250]|uniref:phage portal protein family protein n=1 Tax=Pseudomonas sp. P8_250 TaxID=3043446 RepID=UPI002A36CD0C|nr:hypothetical protein [Pseudomonas sp. P8_250]MDX9668775.1 hypothetical protein [Pseudomonas sp. P8_250]
MDEDNISLETGSNDTPTLTMGEIGRSGLIVLGGNIFEECQEELRWPQAADTFKEMSKDASIAAALDYVDNKVATAIWDVKIPEGYDTQLKAHARFLKECMHDMEHTWTDFIKQAASFGRFGFAPVEKVYRYREKAKGSKYNDLLIAPRKLALRSQDSIDRFRWSGSGKDLAGFYQNIWSMDSNPLSAEGWTYFESPSELSQKFIPRKKFLLFRHNPQKDSPTGTSPLASVWQAWKMKQAYQEAEALGAAQDANAFKILFLPPEYLVADADDDKKESLKMFQKALINAHQARESGIILPFVTDEKGNKMFDFDIKNIGGTSRYDTDKIIARYNQEILVGLFADVLALGSGGGGGSYSLSESKLSVIDLAVAARLDEIRNQLNHDLVRQIFELNGWDTEVMPYFEYRLPEAVNLEELGKFIQRVKAVGMLPVTPKVVNWVLKLADIPYQVDESATTEELLELMGDATSRAGDGMQEGLSNGTGDGTGGGDKSTGNKENA